MKNYNLYFFYYEEFYNVISNKHYYRIWILKKDYGFGFYFLLGPDEITEIESFHIDNVFLYDTYYRCTTHLNYYNLSDILEKWHPDIIWTEHLKTLFDIRINKAVDAINKNEMYSSLPI